MHNPRSSNDRNCERNVNRNNGNRLFDSQNNGAGDYACPRGVGDETFQAENGDATFNSIDTSTGETKPFTQNKRIYYYEGSVLPVEWTVQHGCGAIRKVKCEIVIQYACEDTLDPRVDNFWPWTTKKGGENTEFFGKQHFRSGDHVAAPRDGVPRDSNDAATDTIPDNEESAIPSTKETRRFGMQENRDYYEICQRTERNKGLYTADQAIKRNDRRGTRQNPNGNRHGFECPEERDYYPWWAPSPWVDIAVLSDRADDDGKACYPSTPRSECSKRCQYYMANTMNFNNKGYCDPNHESGTVAQKTESNAWKQRKWYNNQEACVDAGFNWYSVKLNDYLPMDPDSNFVCAHTQYTRTNQLGNSDGIVTSQNENNTALNMKLVAEGLNANRFLWTVPEVPTVNAETYFGNIQSAYKSCVLRMRYNISSGDFAQWPEDAKDSTEARMVDSKNNSAYEGDPVTPLSQDPYAQVGPGDLEEKGEKFLSMAINTNQYGRTFQDRSYVFSIKKRPTENAPASTKLDTPEIDYDAMQANLNAGGRIFNVNVRGKRGNIVQTFPSVEYDFVPNNLVLGKHDMIRFQWTGSDYNPRRGCNNGEGGPLTQTLTRLMPMLTRILEQIDPTLCSLIRPLITCPEITPDTGSESTLNYEEKVALAKKTVLADAPCYDPATDSDKTATQCYDTVMRLAFLNQQLDGGSLVLRGGKNCLTLAELNEIEQNNKNIAEYHPLNCAKINAKPYPYFDAGIMFLKKAGLFSYFSSRNNNFSNRQQIGRMCISAGSECSVDSEGRLNFTGAPQPSTSAFTSPTNCNDGSCIGGSASDPAKVEILPEETEAENNADNDFEGDGVEKGCAPTTDNSGTGGSAKEGTRLSTEEQIGLAFGLFAAGLLIAWLGWMLFKRYNPRKSKAKEDAWLRNSTYERMANETGPHGGNDWTKKPVTAMEAGQVAARQRDPDVPRGAEPEKQSAGEVEIGEQVSRPTSGIPLAEDIYARDSERFSYENFTSDDPFGQMRESSGVDTDIVQDTVDESMEQADNRAKKVTKSQRINYI